MPRFFFDTRDNGSLHPDHAGHEFRDLEAAIAAARKTFADRFMGPGQQGQEPSFRVEIRSSEDSEFPAFILDAASASTPGA
jgi:hypothetical protein